jgi:transcriptional regulator with XRE-family HTH domain
MKSTEKARRQIGEKLRELRIKRGHNNYEVFAYTNNISKYVIFKAENGMGITFDSFLRILEALEVSPKDFFKDFK